MFCRILYIGMKIKQKIFIYILSAVMIGLLLPTSVYAGQCGGIDVMILPDCDAKGITALILLAIHLLTILVGIAAVGGIIYSGILYATAGGNSENTKKAMEMIMNIVIGIVVYALMYVILNFVIPGGLI